ANDYRYVGNNPWNETDPTGMFGQLVSTASSYFSSAWNGVSSVASGLSNTAPTVAIPQYQNYPSRTAFYDAKNAYATSFPTKDQRIAAYDNPAYIGAEMYFQKGEDQRSLADWDKQQAAIAEQQAHNPIYMAMAEAKVGAANAMGHREIEAAVPDNSFFGIAGQTGLLDFARYQYASENSYSQAIEYRDQAIFNAATFVATTAAFEGAGRLLGAALRPVAWESRAASWESRGAVRFAGMEARVAPSYTAFQSQADELCYQAYAGRGFAPNFAAAKLVSSAQLPTLEISASRYPGLAENIYHAQMAGHPQVLTYGGNQALNRAAALQDVPRIVGLSRDEYPFASTMEGGKGSWVGHIAPSQQNAQGGILKNFYEQNNIQPGTQFRVKITR
ncbi:MAG: NucA/NucB deoxyribonuclease domain-containing protein, partial [Planctomycetota bacterium]